jgi:hypothetical protein
MSSENLSTAPGDAMVENLKTFPSKLAQRLAKKKNATVGLIFSLNFHP